MADGDRVMQRQDKESNEARQLLQKCAEHMGGDDMTEAAEFLAGYFEMRLRTCADREDMHKSDGAAINLIVSLARKRA